MVTMQVPVPEQAPPVQPAKEEPAAGAAVKVLDRAGSTDCEQVAPQLMRAGLPVPVTVPRTRAALRHGQRHGQQS